MIRKTANVELGAVQKHANLVEFEKSFENMPLIAKIGLDTAEQTFQGLGYRYTTTAVEAPSVPVYPTPRKPRSR